MWSLITLGTLRLIDDSGEAQLSGRRKELALLAYLARRAPRPTPRAVLAELLWSDRDEDRSRASLRQALSQLRRVLGDVVQATGDHVALPRGAVELDALALESDAAQGRWDGVVSRWNGDFLAGADDLGGEAFHEWLDGERARLRSLAERAFALCVEEREHRGAYREAADLARRWVDAIPDDERAAPALARVIDLLVDEKGPPVEPTMLPANGGRWMKYAAGALAIFAVAGGASLTWYARGAASAPKRPGVDERQLVLVADFRTTGTDTVFGDVVSEALRVDLRQSRALAVYPPAQAQQALRRMNRGAERVDLATAREIAARAGVKAVVEGQIVGSGNRFLLSARLVATITGEEIAASSAEADGSGGILPAVDRLAADLRVRAGESLRAVDEARPVERVTTASLEALAKYVRGIRALDLEAQPSKGAALLEEAIALDSTFAMAYRRLSVELDVREGQQQRVRDLIQHAYEHRHRLTDPERYLVEAGYYSYGPVADEAKAIASYEAALQAEPRLGAALNNRAILLMRRHEFARAESSFNKFIALDRTATQGYNNLVLVDVTLGKLDAADRTVARLEALSPGNPRAAVLRADLLYTRGLRDSAAAAFEGIFTATSDLARRQWVGEVLRDIALAHSKPGEARMWAHASNDARRRRGALDANLVGALDDAWIDLWFGHDTTGALRKAASALARYPLADIPPLDRPYDRLIRLYSWAGKPELARTALAAYDSVLGEHPRLALRPRLPLYRGQIALAERRYEDAIVAFRAADSTSCVTCVMPFLAIAYDRAGVRDSAAALFTRFVTTPGFEQYDTDAMFLPMALRRLQTQRR
jgi:Tfp pilus assembly protein PilF/TolB-like protein